MKAVTYYVLAAALLVLAVSPARSQTRGQERRREAQERFPELSLRLQNPLARVLVVPFDFEYTAGSGASGDGEAFAFRLAPRIPVVLNEDWHLVSKTDVAWVVQDNVVGSQRQEGLSDLTQTFFFSPERSLIWERPVQWTLGVQYFALRKGSAPEWGALFGISLPLRSPRWRLMR